jgi:RimJ/RimL family protein N-acetyltransferase
MVLDEGGRIGRTWGLTIAVAPDGQSLYVGSELPDQVVRDVQRAHDAAPRTSDPAVAPTAFAECEHLLAATGEDVRRRSGPYFLIPPGSRYPPSADITLSSAADPELFRARNPGNWSLDEWAELIEGRLGPWAMATIGGRVVSICHTPRAMTARAAECGVWTAPGFRGHGHAAAVTAAWAELVEPTGRHLFYSTDAGNHSSRRVAARLRLREIGWTWSLTRPDATAAGNSAPGGY